MVSHLKSQFGISLLEILFVIAIIALIASISIPVYSNYTIKANIASELSSLGYIKQQVAEAIINKQDLSLIDINDPNITLDNTTITKDIGSSGTNTINGVAYVLLKPISSESLITWKCILSGDGISTAKAPSNCNYYSSSFFNALEQNSLINNSNAFQVNNNPAPLGSLTWVNADDPFLGEWNIEGGNLEVWNGFDFSVGRAAVAELDGNSNELMEINHNLNTEGFSKMNLSFDYYSRTGDSSSGFQVYLGDELVYEQTDFSQNWQSISIDLDNTDGATSKKLRIMEAGADDSVGAVIDLESLKVKPVELI